MCPRLSLPCTKPTGAEDRQQPAFGPISRPEFLWAAGSPVRLAPVHQKIAREGTRMRDSRSGDPAGRRRRRRGRFAAISLTAALASTLALAAGAHASNVSIGGFPVQFMTYFAPAGEVNDVGVLNGPGGTLVFRESGTVALHAATGCTQIDPQRASCPTAGVSVVELLAGDGADRVRLGASHGAGNLPSICCTVAGGADADTLDAHFITGTNVTLNGNDGTDTLLGGAGNDLLRGGAQADVMTGGDGVDEVSYGDRSVGVTATLDGIANDGTPGFDGGTTTGADSIAADIESLTGGSGDDSLTGDNRRNTLV